MATDTTIMDEVPQVVVPLTHEAIPPPQSETLSTNVEINTALEAACKPLLEQKNPLISAAALARLAGDKEPTPMGKEFRESVIRVLQTDKTAPDAIKSLKLPKISETGAFMTFLEAHKSALPKDSVLGLTFMVNSGRLPISEFAENMLSYQPMREPLLTGLLGDHHAEFGSAKSVLSAAHLDLSPTNFKHLAETFAPKTMLTTKTAGHFDASMALVIGLPLLEMGIGLLAKADQQAEQARH